MSDSDNPLGRPTAAEEDVIRTARADQERCACGEVHLADDGRVSPATVTRMRAYLAAHPEHQFAVDDDAGFIAVIAVRAASDEPQVLACSDNLHALLNHVGAPSAENLS